MNLLKRFACAACLLAAVAGCSKDSGGKTDDPAASTATGTAEPAATGTAPGGATTHAPAGAVPGSHEDWCGEHAVPESQCTRCNPELAAAFKATGDWCAEHGLPESQCLRCNPDLEIVRPPPAGE